ncbi:tRNA nucleotidyltransferase [Brevundimonas phage vB_BpoS-Papperlapapp]|uniref:tRNA nucleotidyltransferase n=1 Tax=Brevundimonas phage vB_BpoS-Domovoi TaxID=2948598 RepID=A0A9E7MRE7_9CAUD|nr:tRNA nucleotidyltransferase [Brevundimonas phage vB_BpoS-Domovoi]USN16089.1 tRNA nucleotidyltransferase [Brevundimonas phage vB_BpoS-Papperlapapp]
MRMPVTPELAAVERAYQERGFSLWFVGGCVRDALRGEAHKDVDLCTDATPDEQQALYEALGLVCYPTGIEFGTLTVVIGAEPYEITTLRTESEHDGRHATVAFTRDLHEDLARRDLTINAMAMTFQGVLIDPYGGADDLDAGVVRFVGDASERIEEDHLRILRFFRFQGRYGRGPLDPAAAAACALFGHGLRGISGERIWVEMKKVVAHDSGPRMVREMRRLGLLEHLEVSGEVLPERMDIAHAHTRDPVVLMSALAKNWPPIAKRWRWSNPETALAKFLENRQYIPPSLKNLKYLLACEKASPAYAEAWARATGVPEVFAEVSSWTVPTLPINGDDFVAKGFKPKEIGAGLMAARLTWALSDYTATREDMLKALDGVRQAPGG